jgi:hypothetical protein
MAQNQRLSRELTALGARPLVNFDITAAQPFQFSYAITSAAVTASDLTLAASCEDQYLRENLGYTADNPQVILRIEAMSMSIQTGTETAIITDQLYNRIAVRHQAAGGRVNSINAASFIRNSSYTSEIDAGPLNLQNRSHQDVYVLASPWQVNCNTDTFEVRPSVAVTTVAGTVLGGLTLYGFAWSVPQGIGTPVECPSADVARALSMGLRAVPEVAR